MKHLTYISRQIFMSGCKFVLILFISFSFNAHQSIFGQINPRKFVDNKIQLSDIADNITYIPLDNSFPISIIYSTSFNILQNAIYLSARDIGIIRFYRDGSMPKVIGKKGRGPGEWQYCMSIAVDDRTETVYVMDSNNEIKIYNKNGIYLRSIKIPKSEDGYDFSGITFYNSRLFASQYISMGHAKYNWIILDTLGNIIKQKLNPIPTFTSNMGGGGGIFKFEDKLSYWNWYNDTIYSISSNFNYKASYTISLGDGKIPLQNITPPSPAEMPNTMAKFYLPISILETKRFLLYRYSHDKKVTLAMIEKLTQKTYLTDSDNRAGGIQNDLDGGLKFIPIHYFTEDNREFLLGLIDPFQLKKFTTSEEFAKNNPKFPEKKKSLKEFGDKINETDNQILMIVRLKK